MSINNLLLLVNRKILSGHERSIKAKKNIAGSFLIRIVNIGINLTLVPLAISYVSSLKYGIWVTISSIIIWFGLFDVGLTSGFRNKFAQALAQNKQQEAKTLVSTTYALLLFIFGSLAILFLVSSRFIRWSEVLNAPRELEQELRLVINTVFTLFCYQFIIKTINTVLNADQKPAYAYLINTIGSVTGFVSIIVVMQFSNDSLFLLSFCYSAGPVLTSTIFTFVLFRKRYHNYTPSFRFIDFKYTNSLLNLGLKFFIISISTVVLFNTNNFIISHLLGPEEVTPYHVTFRYFNVVNMMFGIIIAPFWSATTEAWVKGDYSWIRSVIKKLQKIWLLSNVAIITMLLFSKTIIKLWVGDKIVIDFSLSVIIAIYFSLFTWQTIFINFLNGVSKIKLQLICVATAALVNIPLAIYLTKIIGITGIVLTQSILFLFIGLILYTQYNKIINKRAFGIWGQ